MGRAASGNASVLALAIGRLGNFGEPKSGLIKYPTLLPIDADLIGEETPSGQVNPSGFLRRAIPGKKSGTHKFPLALTVKHLLEFFEHVFGAVTKANPAGSIYTYTFTPAAPASHKDTHLWGFLDLSPVERMLFYGIKYGLIELEIGDNEEIVVNLEGMVQHGTLLSPPNVDAGNTGTYALGPYIRGLVADPTAGSIWIYIVDDAPVLQFKVIQSTTEPDGAAWAAATTVFDVVLDENGRGAWQNLQSSEDGLDLGVWAENKDPLEIIFPGTATDHQDTAAADVWEFKMPGAWSTPSATDLGAARRFTSAHWLSEFSIDSGSTWLKRAVNDGKIGFGWDIEFDGSNLSRYPNDILRPGEFEPTLELERAFVDTLLRNQANRHTPIQGRMSFLGKQLSNAYREGIVITYPALAVTKSTRPVKKGKVVESLLLTGETNDAGDAPCTVVVTTDRNWTVTA